MAAIYAITNIITNQKYIGKSIDPNSRWRAHRYSLTCDVRGENTNRHMFGSVKKYGIENFTFEILETFVEINEELLKDRELYWMDFHKSCDRKFGFNLRRDSSTKCTMSDETKELMKGSQVGEKNGNYGNKWTPEQKQRMSEIAKARHASGLYYGEEWRATNAATSTKTWSDLEKRKAMGAKVKIAKRKYYFNQYRRSGTFIRRWESVDEIILNNPTWKWQNIYSVCNGYKPTYRNFKWEKVEKDDKS